MKYNVESIIRPHVKGIARFINDNCIQVNGDGENEITYNSIQVFANHWRFIEDKPKELLKPAVITFIKHYLILNDIKLDQVKSIRFEDYNSWCVITIEPKNGISLYFESRPHLIDFDLIEECECYTLEELGIK